MKSVVVLGATPKPDRYAFMAMQRLQEHGYKAIPVNPAFDEILGERCHPSISEVPRPIDTVTVYLSAARSAPLIADILNARPNRIIFNPGAENDELAQAASSAGLEVVTGCTLVMLASGTF
jgi:predicted CoA-binding protein